VLSDNSWHVPTGAAAVLAAGAESTQAGDCGGCSPKGSSSHARPTSSVYEHTRAGARAADVPGSQHACRSPGSQHVCQEGEGRDAQVQRWPRQGMDGGGT